MSKGFGAKSLKDIRDQSLAEINQNLLKDTISTMQLRLTALQFIPVDLFADFFAWNIEMQGHDYEPEQINYEAYKLLNSDPRKLSQWLSTGLFYAFAHQGVSKFCVRTAEILTTYVTGFDYSENILFNNLLKGVTILDHDCFSSYEDSNDDGEEEYRLKDIDANIYESLLSDGYDEYKAYAIGWLTRQKRDASNLFFKAFPKIVDKNKQVFKNNLCKIIDRIPEHYQYEFLVQFYDWVEGKANLFSKLK